MNYFIYVLLAIPVLMLGLFFAAFVIATVMDWWHYRQNRVLILLSRDHTKPRRPAAK